MLFIDGIDCINSTDCKFTDSNGNSLIITKAIYQSQQEYQKALGKAPDNPAVHYNLGIPIQKNSFEDAVKSYDAGLEAQPG